MTEPQDPGSPHDVRIMTTSEVAAWLSLSVPTLMSRVRAGEIPASRIGAEWRFWRPTLEVRLFAQGPAAESGDDQAEVLTTAQLADRLRLTGETVRARIEDGSIPASRIGNQFRIFWPTIRGRLEAGEDFTPAQRTSSAPPGFPGPPSTP